MNTLRFMLKRLMETAGADGDAGGAGGEGGDQPNAEQQAATQQRAREMGWAPKEQWRGNPDGWLDAGEFVRRGEQVMPILQANLRKRDTQVTSLQRQIEQQAAQLQAANESLQVLTNLSTEQTRQAAKEKRRELLRAQAQARTDGNTDLEIDLGEQIADVTSQITKEEAAPAAKPKAAATPKQQQQPAADDPTAHPDYQAFVQENSWFGTDNRRTALATAIGQELRQDPANAGLVGKPFFDRVVAEVNKIFTPPRQTTSKVEGGAGNGAGGNRNDNSDIDAATGKSYADLPADAKSACERSSKLVVGEGRAFKDMAAWRKHYVSMYFNS